MAVTSANMPPTVACRLRLSRSHTASGEARPAALVARAISVRLSIPRQTAMLDHPAPRADEPLGDSPVIGPSLAERGI